MSKNDFNVFRYTWLLVLPLCNIYNLYFDSILGSLVMLFWCVFIGSLFDWKKGNYKFIQVFKVTI